MIWQDYRKVVDIVTVLHWVPFACGDIATKRVDDCTTFNQFRVQQIPAKDLGGPSPGHQALRNRPAMAVYAGSGGSWALLRTQLSGPGRSQAMRNQTVYSTVHI